MTTNMAMFSVAVLEEGTKELYARLYGDPGGEIVESLNNSPGEIAVVSRMIAYLEEKLGGEKDGFEENCTGNRSVRGCPELVESRGQP